MCQNMDFSIASDGSSIGMGTDKAGFVIKDGFFADKSY